MKILKYILVSVGAIAAIILIALVYITNFLPNIKAEDIKVEITPERVARGEYLANHVALCIDCHAKRDWEKLAGPPISGTEGAGGEEFLRHMGFPGNFYSPNITPYNLGDWTDGEIFRAITSGVKKNGDPIFPLMPFNNYGKMDREDIYSIIAYIRTLPSKENKTKESEADFPLSIIMHMIPKEAELTGIPDKSNVIEYGQYITNASGCIDCHTPFDGKELVYDMAFAGGREFNMPFGKLSAPNITFDKNTGIGSWSEELFVKKFKSFDPDSGYSDTPASMDEYNTVMPWIMYAGMKSEDLKAIYAYLKSLKPITHKVEKIDIDGSN